MVIVFGDEMQVIDNPHGLLETRMEECPRQETRGDLFKPIKELETGGTELGEDFAERAIIVVGLMGLAIREIGGRELCASGEEIANSCGPEWFEVEEVSGVFLRGPLLRFGTPSKNLA